MAHTALGRRHCRLASEAAGMARVQGKKGNALLKDAAAPLFIFTFHFRSIMNYNNTVLHSNFHLTKNYHRPYVFTQRRRYFSLETILVNLLKCVLLVCFLYTN